MRGRVGAMVEKRAGGTRRRGEEGAPTLQGTELNSSQSMHACTTKQGQQRSQQACFGASTASLSIFRQLRLHHAFSNNVNEYCLEVTQRVP